MKSCATVKTIERQDTGVSFLLGRGTGVILRVLLVRVCVLIAVARVSPQELSKARDRLEKATAESTEMVFDSAVTALAKGLDKVVNEGKDAIPEGEDTEKFTVST